MPAKKKELSLDKIQQAYTTPPHSPDAEKGVISSMMQEPKKVIPKVVQFINEEYFFIPANREHFINLKTQCEKGEVYDLISYTQFLRDNNTLDSLGGASAVTSIHTFIPTAANVDNYVDIVKDKYLLRQMIAAGTLMVHKSYTEQDEPLLLLDEVHQKIVDLGKTIIIARKTLAEHVQDKMERMERGEADEDIVKTRIKELDRISPIRKGDMPVITGQRKFGKSIFATTILENICISGKLPGIIFSLESPASEITDRIFAGVSRIPMGSHHVNKLTKEEMKKATDALAKIAAANIIIHDDIYDLHAISSSFRTAFLDNPALAIGVLDYAQLCRGIKIKGGSREQEVSSISRTIRLLSLETKVPFLLLSQENKEGETRESKSLEQDCTALWKIKLVNDQLNNGQRMIEVSFQRNGESGVAFPVAFLGPIARVENAAKSTEF